MNITDEHVAALRAQLNGDIQEFQERADRLMADPDRGGFNALLVAGFFLEMQRRFPANGDVAERVVEFVGQVRAQVDSKGEWLEPTAAQKLIRHAALGEGDIQDIDSKTLGGLQIALLTASIRDRGPASEEIDAFLSDVRRTAESRESTTRNSPPESTSKRQV